MKTDIYTHKRHRSKRCRNGIIPSPSIIFCYFIYPLAISFMHNEDEFLLFLFFRCVMIIFHPPTPMFFVFIMYLFFLYTLSLYPMLFQFSFFLFLVTRDFG